ncbi:MAG: spermidine synthase [Gammaproteobacteria bacterium HGW-Gammaproteobacteria-11]|nr:MAG: spermidine synthase [Gammaproteobacteria bacterium HGW-Gammaproteobacteria-11]
MTRLFEEIDIQPSAIGEISLRRRRIPALGDRDIYEVKLGEEFLMSSMFPEAEIALSRLGLAAVSGDQLSVVVGGLGLGYTAVAALEDQRVGELLIIDYLDTVIQWHRDEKVPLGKILNADPRNRYVHGSFFDLAIEDGGGFDPAQPGRQFDAILLDIDHSPRALLHASNASFYTRHNLALMCRQLRQGGVFALWSQDPPDAEFMAVMNDLFSACEAHVVPFFNPFQNCQSTNTVYVGVKP